MAHRNLAIGDIHGCSNALRLLLDHLKPDGDDVLIVLGDVVDRGPDSNGVLNQLLELDRSTRLILIRGNHEEMMLDALQGGQWGQAWMRYGGLDTIESYGGDPMLIPQEHLDLLASAIDYWETDDQILIHANLQPEVPLDLQPPQWLRWNHLTGSERPDPSGREVICGHTPQRSGVPWTFPGWVCIDTLAYAGGWLTCLDLDTDDFVQTNENGELREGQLTESEAG